MSDPAIDARRSMGFLDRPSGPVTQVFGPQHNIFAAERAPLKIDPAALESAQQHVDRLPLDRVPDLAALPDVSRMPLARNPFFVGRTSDLIAIARGLKTPDTTVCPTVAITGMAGVGKSQLASEFVHRYGQFFAGGVFWLSFADASAVPSEIAACGSDRMPGLRPAFDRLTPEEQLQEMRAALQSPIPRLLVFDNCEDEELLVRWRPTTGGCRVLLTSRRAHWTGAVGVQSYPLDVLRMAESITLLRNHRPDLTSDNPALHEIAAELGHLPLALHLAGSFLADYRNSVSPAEYLAQLRSPALLQHPSLQRSGYSPTSHEQDVARTFALSYERLDRDDPVDRRAREMLARAAYLAPGELIDWQLLRATLEPVTPALLDDDALRRLVETGLLESPSGGVFRMHRLLALFVRTTVAEPAVQHAVEQALLDLVASFKRAQLPKLPALLVPHLRSAADAALPRGNELAASLCSAVAEDSTRNGAFASARRYAEQALAIREQVLGLEHPDTASSLNDLAEVLREQGEYAAARPLYERGLAIREQVLGPEHADTANSLNNLAMLLYQQRDYTNAKSMLERALHIHDRVFGSVHPNTFTLLSHLAQIHLFHGNRLQARQYFTRALAVAERHPHLIEKVARQQLQRQLAQLGGPFKSIGKSKPKSKKR
jgi:tetratricopeptide (TPR) repeat protein